MKILHVNTFDRGGGAEDFSFDFVHESGFDCTLMVKSKFSKLKRHRAYKEADIIHLHNIHGGFFDISAFAKIAREKKIVWTLHDMWFLTGGEAYTFGNENFKKGIGHTPFGEYYPLKSPF